MFYYKQGQTLLQIGAAALLLQIGAKVITNWGSYNKLGQVLLQNRAGIASRAELITNWGIIDAVIFYVVLFLVSGLTIK